VSELLAIDPGPTESAYLWLEHGKPTAFAKAPNDCVLGICRASANKPLVIEQVASYGMPVGAEVFETVFFEVVSLRYSGSVVEVRI
jgi:hypothetical protein